MNDQTERRGPAYWLNQLENLVLVFGFVVIIVVGFIQVVMRTVFNNSLTWSEELIRYVYIWLCWIGISLTERRGEHIQLTFVLGFFSERVQQILGLSVSLLLIGFTAWLAWLGFTTAQAVFITSSTSTALKIPLYLVYLAFPAGCTLYCIRVLVKFFRQARAFHKV